MRKIAHTSTKVEVFNTDIYVGVTPIAEAKMNALVQGCSLEIAWRGVVNRIDDWTFIIEDVYLPKQTVTGASVEIEAEDMTNLRNRLVQEGVIEPVTDPNAKPTKGLYFHGHSHVNMGVTPSGIDEATRKEEMESNVPFYVWMIRNKRGETSCCVYIDNTNDQPGGMPTMGSGLLYRDVPHGLWVPDVMAGVQTIRSEIEAKVSEKKYSYTSTYKGWGDAYDEYGKAVPATTKKKTTPVQRLFDTADDGTPTLDEEYGLGYDDGQAMWDSMTPSERAEALADGTFQKKAAAKKKEMSAVTIPAWTKNKKGETVAADVKSKKVAPKNSYSKTTILVNGRYTRV